jgi:hypothetical protein
MLQNNVFCRFGQDNKFCHVLQLEQVPIILKELHGGIGGTHFSLDITVRKFLDAGYMWPIKNINVHEFCRTCDLCQKTCNMLTQNIAKSIFIMFEKPFYKSELDFIGPIKLMNHYFGN